MPKICHKVVTRSRACVKSAKKKQQHVISPCLQHFDAKQATAKKYSTHTSHQQPSTATGVANCSHFVHCAFYITPMKL